MSVHPLLDQIILNRNKDIVETSYIDAMVVELVPTGVESLGVVVVHLLKANRAGVRVLQVLGQRNAREQNRRNHELGSAQNLLIDERWWWLGGPLWGELNYQLANLEIFFTFLLPFQRYSIMLGNYSDFVLPVR